MALATASRKAHVHGMDMHATNMNARLVVMMTPREKQDIERRARGLSLTTSELVRRAAQTYEQPDTEQDAVFDALADELEAAATSMREDLNRALAAFDEYQADKSRRLDA